MPLPLEYRDIDKRIDSIFKTGEEYDETRDITGPKTLPPSVSDNQAEEWMEAIEETGDDNQKYDFDPVEPFQKHSFDGDANSRLKNNVFIGIDGANQDIKREELILLKARGIAFFYSFHPNISQSKIEFPSRGFYILKPGILKEGYEDYVEIEEEAGDAVDVEAVESKRWMFLRYKRGGNSSNPYMQAMGASVKMMQLAEIAAAHNAIDHAISNGVPSENVHVLFDGSIPPKSIEPDTYTQEFLNGKQDKEHTPFLESNTKIYSVTKRISSSRLFVQLLQKKRDSVDHLIDLPKEDLEEEYITDAALMRDLLNKGEYTSFIRYRDTYSNDLDLGFDASGDVFQFEYGFQNTTVESGSGVSLQPNVAGFTVTGYQEGTETDSTAPSVSIDRPENTTYSNADVLLNGTANESSSFTYSLDGGSNTSLGSGTTFSTTMQSVSNGTHTVAVYGEDSAGNIGSDSVTFTVDNTTEDTTPPSTTSNATTDTWLARSQDTVEKTCTDQDSGVKNMSVVIDGGSPQTTTSSSIEVTVSGDGNHTLDVTCYDNADNRVQDSYFVALDSTPPTGSILSPENTTYQDQTEIDLNTTQSDATSGVNLDEYSLDGSGYSSFNPNSSVSGLSDGQHSISYRVTDNAGNQFTTDTRYFYVNLTGPKYFIESVPSGKAAAPASDPTADLTDFSNAVKNEVDVLFGDSLGSDYAAELRINFTDNVTADGLVTEFNRSQRKSVVHNTSSVANVLEKSLLVPRELDSGKVHICPGAENLSSIELGCSNGYNISAGESVNGVSLSETTINSESYYKAKGVSGTGGFELDTSSSDTDSGSGGGGSGPTSDDSGENVTVVFDSPTVGVYESEGRSVDVTVTNKIEEDSNVVVEAPSDQACRLFEVQTGFGSQEFGDSGEFTVAGESQESFTVYVEIPDDYDGDSLSCDFGTSADPGTAGNLSVTAEKRTGLFAWAGNEVFSVPLGCENTSAVLEGEDCEPRGEFTATAGDTVAGLSALFAVAGVFLFWRRSR